MPFTPVEAQRFFEKCVFGTRYTHNFTWLGTQIIQLPQDIQALQEIVSDVDPELIIETGIAHGGSLVLFASLLCMGDLMNGRDPRSSGTKVVGIDIDIRPENRRALDEHPLRFKMELIEGSSVHPPIVESVQSMAEKAARVLVALDSNHTHDHVLQELISYANLVSVGSYCIVLDTAVEYLPAGSFPDRPWEVGNNPMSAAMEWLKENPNFEADRYIDEKLVISTAPQGYLKRIK